MAPQPHPMRYIPIVYCLKCKHNVGVITRSVRPKEQAKLVAMCHKERQVIDFATEPGTTVNAFPPE